MTSDATRYAMLLSHDIAICLLRAISFISAAAAIFAWFITRRQALITLIFHAMSICCLIRRHATIAAARLLLMRYALLRYAVYDYLF